MTAGYIVARRLANATAASRMPLIVRPVGRWRVDVSGGVPPARSGSWGLWLDGGRHLRVEGPSHSVAGHTMWELADGGEPLSGPLRGRWTGIVHPNLGAAGLEHEDVLVPSRVGALPAWVASMHAATDLRVWAVHIHGLGSSRAGTIRGVLSATAAGLPSFIPAYRNTAEGPHVGHGRSGLGVAEAQDISDCLGYLRDRFGAERFILFGWSMGAQIALTLAADNDWGHAVEALVLDSPVLDWESVASHNLARTHLPRRWAGRARTWLEGPLRSKLVGMNAPVDLGAMNWVRRAGEVKVPVLVQHGREDRSVPLRDSIAFAAAASAASAAQVRVIEGAGHTTGWNVDPSAWDQATAAFLSEVGHGVPPR